ncbi:hypothetical protein LB504_013178 [Fusarium proliferatum]|nr:hypothetical protein LB504_013178 [Fusarium proliferatum]
MTPVTLPARPFKNSTPRLPTETETEGDGSAGTTTGSTSFRSRDKVNNEVTLLDRRRTVRATNVALSDPLRT